MQSIHHSVWIMVSIYNVTVIDAPLLLSKGRGRSPVCALKLIIRKQLKNTYKLRQVV